MDTRAIDPNAALRELLRKEHLPTEDLDDPTIELFGAYDNGQLVGAIGLQRCGDLGLLRSLAVDPSMRGRGMARGLCEVVFARARASQLEAVWLLTTSAQEYFSRLGFEVVDRATTPSDIRATSQFSSLCPASAVVMRSRIESST